MSVQTLTMPGPLCGQGGPLGRTLPATTPSVPWRGTGGHTPTRHTIEFDKQLDKISLWVDDWSHEERCALLEAVVVRSAYSQLQFLWTVLQPALHRDFMYTASKEFPAANFLPLSTHRSRRLKERLANLRQDNFHRVTSAHVQHYKQIRRITLSETASSDASVETTLPSLPQSTSGVYLPELPSASHPKLVERPHTPREATRGGGGEKVPSLPRLERTHTQGSVKKTDSSALPRTASRLTTARGARTAPSSESLLEKLPTKECLSIMHSAPPSVRFLETPVRRHMQSGEAASGSGRHLPHPHTAPQTRDKKRRQREGILLRRSLSELQLTSTKLPPDAGQVLVWYTTEWTDVQRNEFLHKFILKLDPRQQYFLSSFLSVKQCKDFISLLPIHLSLRVLCCLSPCDLGVASQVNKTWYKLCNSNELWRRKCMAVNIEIPIQGACPDWKHVYRENMHVQLNWSQGRHTVVDCRGHTDRVLCATLNDKLLVTGSVDKTVRVWDVISGRCTQTLSGHMRGVWCVKFFTNTLLVSGSYDCTIKVWNLRDKSCARTLLGHHGPVWAVVTCQHLVVSASQDCTARVWDGSRCVLLHRLEGHKGPVFAVDIDETGSTVVTGSADKTVRLWDARCGTVRRVVRPEPGAAVMAVSLRQGVLAASFSTTIHVYRLTDTHCRLVRTYREHDKRIESLQLRVKDGGRGEGLLISGGKDGMLKYWDLTRERSAQTFEGHTGTINCVTCDEFRIVTASFDNKIKIWDFSINNNNNNNNSSGHDTHQDNTSHNTSNRDTSDNTSAK